MATVTVKPNQSLMDVAIAEYGTVEAVDALAAANGLPVSDIPAAGTVLVRPEVATTDDDVLQYLSKKKAIPATANLSECYLPTVAVSSVGDNEATFTIGIGENGVAYEWAVQPAAAEAPATGTQADTETVEATGLAAETNYKVWVRTKCMGNHSGWVSASFTTTAASMLLDASVILYPLQKVQVGFSAPNYYAFLQKKNAQFIATKGLRPLFLTTNKMYLISKAFFISSGSGSSSYISSPLTSMVSGGAIYYKPAIPAPGEDRMYWCDPMEPIKTHTYKDLQNNEAVIMPLVFVNDAYNTAEILYPEISMTVLERTESNVTVRITRSHAAIGWDDVSLRGLQWQDDAVGGDPDPDDPLNDDKTILRLSVGVTTIGVKAAYETDDSVVAYPDSRIQMVIEVA